MDHRSLSLIANQCSESSISNDYSSVPSVTRCKYHVLKILNSGITATRCIRLKNHTRASGLKVVLNSFSPNARPFSHDRRCRRNAVVRDDRQIGFLELDGVQVGAADVIPPVWVGANTNTKSKPRRSWYRLLRYNKGYTVTHRAPPL